MAVALATLLVGLAATLARPVGAQTPGDPSLLVTDYQNYPDTPQTAVGPDCDAGDITLNGVRVNGGPLAANLAALPELVTGDTVTAELISGPDCVGGILSLTIKAADTPTFDPSRNQRNVAFSYDAVVALGEGRTTLIELIIPPMPDDEDCFYQLDVVTGYPLAVVGPEGSFYHPSSRGDQLRNMLVDARNGALTACTESTTTTSGSTTSTTASTTSTTGAPTTTTAASSSVTQPPSSAVGIPAAGGGSTAAAVLGARVGTIPATGPGNSGPLALVGIVILLTGAAMLGQGWRLRRS